MSDWGKVVENASYRAEAGMLPTKGSDAEVVQHLIDHHGMHEDLAPEYAEHVHTYHGLMHTNGHKIEGRVADKTVPHTHEGGGTQFPANVKPHVEGDALNEHLNEHHPDIAPDSFTTHQRWHQQNDHKSGESDHVHDTPEYPEDHAATIQHLKDAHGVAHPGSNPVGYHLSQHDSSYNENNHSHKGEEPTPDAPEHHEHEHIDKTDHLVAMHGYKPQHLAGKHQTQLSHEHMTMHQNMEGPADHHHPENGGAQPWKWGTHKGPLDETGAFLAHMHYGHNSKPSNYYGSKPSDLAIQQLQIKHGEMHAPSDSPITSATHSHKAGEGMISKHTVEQVQHPTPKEDLADDPEALHAHWVAHHWNPAHGDLPILGDDLQHLHNSKHASPKYDQFNETPHHHKAKVGEPSPKQTIQHPKNHVELADHMAVQHGMEDTGSKAIWELKDHHQMAHDPGSQVSPTGTPAHTHPPLDENHKESALTSHQGSSDLLDFFKDNA